jgi:hypothetical protein
VGRGVARRQRDRPAERVDRVGPTPLRLEQEGATRGVHLGRVRRDAQRAVERGAGLGVGLVARRRAAPRERQVRLGHADPRGDEVGIAPRRVLVEADRAEQAGVVPAGEVVLPLEEGAIRGGVAGLRGDRDRAAQARGEVARGVSQPVELGGGAGPR